MDLPGERSCLPGYEVLGELGRGGMGVVYKAHHLRLNRVVALKMILAGGHAGSAEIQRFLSEAEAVAAVAHPNIVQIYEVGHHQGLPFIALEFVDGGTLADRLRKGTLPAREAARLIEQLARGLNAAHQAGIVHRDLKPANILLLADGTRSTSIVRDLLNLAMIGLRNTQEHLLLLGRKNALERVAAFLLDMAKRTKSGSVVELAMARHDIADYLGLTLETVSRMFAELKEQGAIKLEGARRVHLLDRGRLTAMSA